MSDSVNSDTCPRSTTEAHEDIASELEITKAVAFMHKKSFSEAVAVLKSFEKKVLPRTTRCTRARPSPSDHTSLLILRAGSLRVL